MYKPEISRVSSHFFVYQNKYKKLKKVSVFKNKCNYLKKDKILRVVDLAKEAIGKTINKIARLTIMKKERLGYSIKKKQIKVKTAQYITAKNDAHP